MAGSVADDRNLGALATLKWLPLLLVTVAFLVAACGGAEAPALTADEAMTIAEASTGNDDALCLTADFESRIREWQVICLTGGHTNHLACVIIADDTGRRVIAYEGGCPPLPRID